MHLYLFEAKSVQAYLFASGKLKDVIAASERLDRLVDDNEKSTLFQVLEAAGLHSNLLDKNATVEGDTIGFIRCKGGAFYAWCQQREPLQRLRSLWTLTVAQLFPGLETTDALVEGATLGAALNAGHTQLAASRNTPSISFPIASAPTSVAPRTGKAAVEQSREAKKETHKETSTNTYHTSHFIDIDTEQHRQAYRLLELRNETLFTKFTGQRGNNGLPEKLTFPRDFDDFPSFKNPDDKRESTRDMALLHLDGNGLGLLLRGLQEALQKEDDHTYATAFRSFSDALDTATRAAAEVATIELYNSLGKDENGQLSLMKEKNEVLEVLPMRPIVLGGDDVTLFCQADKAIAFASTFCREFKEQSQQALKQLYSTYLKNTGIKPYLTASGGILFHKANHPFITCHAIVEGLCAEAKKATKAMVANDEHSEAAVGPAALSFYRLGSALAEKVESLRRQSQHFALNSNSTLVTSLGGYLVDEPKTASGVPSLPQLNALLVQLRKRRGGQPMPLAIPKLRQMITELAQGNHSEAQRIYARAALEMQKNHSGHWAQLEKSMQRLCLQGALQANQEWYWAAQEGHESWINDVLVYAHFTNTDHEFTAAEHKEVANG